MKPRRSMPPGTARSRMVTVCPFASSAAMTTGPSPRSHDPVPPVTATFIDLSTPIARPPHPPFGHLLPQKGEGNGAAMSVCRPSPYGGEGGRRPDEGAFLSSTDRSHAAPADTQTPRNPHGAPFHSDRSPQPRR